MTNWKELPFRVDCKCGCHTAVGLMHIAPCCQPSEGLGYAAPFVRFTNLGVMGDSILRDGRHLTRKAVDGRWIEWKIDGAAVTEAEFSAAMGAQYQLIQNLGVSGSSATELLESKPSVMTRKSEDAQLALGDAQMEVERLVLDLPDEASAEDLMQVVNLIREASSLLGDWERKQTRATG